jgi:long-chain-fatty-acid---luciferin-component ligase
MDHHGPDGTTLPPTCPQLAVVLADDVGDVETGTCGCGRTSQVINLRGRGQGGGRGHCPVSIECYLGWGTPAHDKAVALVKA